MQKERIEVTCSIGIDWTRKVFFIDIGIIVVARKWKQGIYKPKNYKKYIGTKDPVFRSSFELQMFKYLDRSPAVISWGAECEVVKYYNPVKQRNARYIVDIIMKYKDVNGNIKTELIEIKPYKQTQPPVRGNKRHDLYEGEVLEFAINRAKWEAAAKYAEERGWNFRVITENQLFRG